MARLFACAKNSPLWSAADAGVRHVQIMNIDQRMNQFRLASRNLFNEYFYIAKGGDEAIDAEKRYSNILESLFLNMVIYPLDLPKIPYYETQESIKVVLNTESHAPWMLNREINCGYWDHPVDEFDSTVKINFEYFFDWDELALKDNLYVRGVVAEYPNKEELVGKSVLVECQYITYQFA